MRRFSGHSALSALLLFLVAGLAAPIFAHTLDGTVVKVHDGDTITVDPGRGERLVVRLQGIDAPELSQAFGREARQHLTSLLLGQRVQIHWKKKDRHGRLVGKVLLAGRDVDRELLLAGFAWHFKRYEQEQSAEDRLAYQAAETDARAERAGLWRDEAPVAPWTHREAKRIGASR